MEIGGCELVKASPNREMLCKRCECVSECECNVIREGVALVVRSLQNSFCLLFVSPPGGPLPLNVRVSSIERKVLPLSVRVSSVKRKVLPLSVRYFR